MVKDKGFKVLFVLYILFFIGDLVTTLLVENKEILETNPIYDKVGFTGIIVINLALA